MISVVVVYSNEGVLNEVLLAGLRRQNVPYELIALANTDGRFKSAAEALNHGAERATGRYILFIHQDVELDSETWLERFEKRLDTLPDFGAAGVAGVTETPTGEVRRYGFISTCGSPWGTPDEVIHEVQTLDECLIATPRSVFNDLKLDAATFDGWHCYGADYCLCLQARGLKAYTLPFFIHHRSVQSNTTDLLKYQKRLHCKHGRRRIRTASGLITSRRLWAWTVVQWLAPGRRLLAPSWVEYLKRELADCQSVLDLGCGYSSPILHCRVGFSTGVDWDETCLEETRKKAIHNQYLKADIRTMDFPPGSYDAVLCLRTLEHLTKAEGLDLIERMGRWARKKVVITTGSRPYWQERYAGSPRPHTSVWKARDLRRMGYRVRGMSGWGYSGVLRYGPPVSPGDLLDLSQRVLRYFPGLAYQLFATKHTDEGKTPYHDGGDSITRFEDVGHGR